MPPLATTLKIISNFQYLQFNNLKLQTSNLANHHLDVIKQLKELQFRILDQELNRWKREQQLSGNGATFHNNLDTIQKWCEDLALIIWNNMQQIHQLAIIQVQFTILNRQISEFCVPKSQRTIKAESQTWNIHMESNCCTYQLYFIK